jgi:hypothetical protein
VVWLNLVAIRLISKLVFLVGLLQGLEAGQYIANGWQHSITHQDLRFWLC